MEASQENVTENLAAAAAKAAVEGEVRGSDSDTQMGDMKEKHDGLVKGFDFETQRGDMKEEDDDDLVEGSDRKDGPLNGEIYSSDVPKIVLDTEVLSVEEKEEGPEIVLDTEIMQDMNGLRVGKEAEKETDISDGPIVDTIMVSVEERQEIVQAMDVFENVKEAEKGVVNDDFPTVVTENVSESEVVLAEEKEESEGMDGLEVVKEAENGTESSLGVDNLEKNGVQESEAQKVGESVMNMDGLEVVKEAENGTESSLGVDNLEKNGVQESEAQKVGESVMNVNDEKSENSDEEDVGENGHEFAVGDFIWGKIKSYPWWPGQIYDPSDASKYAEKRIVKGCLLVAYFGDNSFSWCRKSQLKRFAENFDEMSSQNKSKNFIHAVSEALDGFNRAVEMEMSSLYLPLEKNHNWDFKARNRGIKAGVVVPRGDYLKLFLTRLEPEQLLRNLRHAAKTGFGASPLELRVLKSWLAGFYYNKGGYFLAEFHEPVPIEGMEDKMGNGVFVPLQGPADDEWTAIQTTSEDKVYGRKRKNMDDILEADMLGIELMHSGESVNELKLDKKKWKIDFRGENDNNNSSVKKLPGKRGRKKKAETETRSPESVQNGETEKGEKDGKEETLESFSSRERKKSKYLSAPYTTPEVSTSKMGERMTRVAGQLIGSTPILTSCNRQLNKKKHSKQVDDNLAVNEVLSVITNAAVDPMNTGEIENLDQITGFVSAFRSSVSSDGSKESAGEDGRKKKIKEGEVSLLITFPPSFTFPTKGNLLEIFGKFGEINEMETDVYGNSFSAQVAFVRKSDAEEAYKECLKNNFFGDGNINYRLLYPIRKAQKKTVTGLGLIRKKLEKLTSEVKNLDGKVTAEVKKKLEAELKDLITEVSILPETSP